MQSGMDGMDDVTRRGALGLRAEVRELRRQLYAVQAERDTAVQDAKALSQFIVDRGQVRTWQHADVLRIVHTIMQGTLHRLLGQTANAVQKRIPASHVLYQRLGERMREDLIAEIGRVVENDLTRPDMLTDEMTSDLDRIMRGDGEK